MGYGIITFCIAYIFLTHNLCFIFVKVPTRASASTATLAYSAKRTGTNAGRLRVPTVAPASMASPNTTVAATRDLSVRIYCTIHIPGNGDQKKTVKRAKKSLATSLFETRT